LYLFLFPKAVTEAARMISSEPVERYAVFRTNQGTDMHLLHAGNIAEVRDLHSYRLEGKVSAIPKTICGGHVFFKIRDERGDEIGCAAFEPTKNFRDLVRRLIPGDQVILSGSVTSMTLNIEKMEIKTLVPLFIEENPLCPECKKHMKSAGRGQGFRCKQCDTEALSKIRYAVERDIDTGLYEVPPCARRHLAKPLIREKRTDIKVHPSR